MRIQRSLRGRAESNSPASQPHQLWQAPMEIRGYAPVAEVRAAFGLPEDTSPPTPILPGEVGIARARGSDRRPNSPQSFESGSSNSIYMHQVLPPGPQGFDSSQLVSALGGVVGKGSHLLGVGYEKPIGQKDIRDLSQWPRLEECDTWNENFQVLLTLRAFAEFKRWKFQYTSREDFDRKRVELESGEVKNLGELLASDGAADVLEEFARNAIQAYRLGKSPFPPVDLYGELLSGLRGIGFIDANTPPCNDTCLDGTYCELSIEPFWSTFHRGWLTGRSSGSWEYNQENAKYYATYILSLEFALEYEIHFAASCTCGWV